MENVDDIETFPAHVIGIGILLTTRTDLIEDVKGLRREITSPMISSPSIKAEE